LHSDYVSGVDSIHTMQFLFGWENNRECTCTLTTLRRCGETIRDFSACKLHTYIIASIKSLFLYYAVSLYRAASCEAMHSTRGYCAVLFVRLCVCHIQCQRAKYGMLTSFCYRLVATSFCAFFSELIPFMNCRWCLQYRTETVRRLQKHCACCHWQHGFCSLASVLKGPCEFTYMFYFQPCINLIKFAISITSKRIK